MSAISKPILAAAFSVITASAVGQTLTIDDVSPTVVDYLDNIQLPDDVLIAEPPDETGEDAGGSGPAVDFSGELLPPVNGG